MTKSEISTLVTAIVAALEEQQVQPKAVAKPKAKVAKATPKVSKAAKKAANQKLMRSINGKLAAATKASDTTKARRFLKEAMSMTPANWTSVQNQIVRKHEVLGIKV